MEIAKRVAVPLALEYIPKIQLAIENSNLPRFAKRILVNALEAILNDPDILPRLTG